MPSTPFTVRELLHDRYWDRIRERQERRGPGVAEAYFIAAPPLFVDYWPDVPATEPEKMVFLALAQREVNFYFSYYVGDFPFTEDTQESYRPDFILPDYRIIIEVQGIYWHTRPGMWEHDAVKYGFYTTAGYDVHFLTDAEILQDVNRAIDEEIPILRVPPITGTFIGIGDRPFDPIASVEARMRKYPKVERVHYAGTKKASVSSQYATRGPGIEFEVGPLFDPADLEQSYIDQLLTLGQDWVNYMNDLGDMFQDANAILAYPEQYAYWLKWKDWWTKYAVAEAPYG